MNGHARVRVLGVALAMALTAGSALARVEADAAAGLAIRADHMVLDAAVHGDWLLLATQSGRIEVYDRRNGEALAPALITESPGEGLFPPTIRSIALSPDGAQLAAASSDGRLRVLTFDEGHADLLSERLVPGLMVVTYLDERRLLLADMRGELALLDLKLGEESYRRQLDYDPIYSLTLSPSGSRLAVAFRSSRVQLVEPVSGRTETVLRGHLDSVFAAAWLDENELVTAGKDKRLVAWRVRGGEAVSRVLYQGDHYVTAVAVDRERGLVTFPIADFEVAVIRVSGGEQLHRLRGHTAPVQCLIFVDDGRGLISAGHDARVFVWRLDPEVSSGRANERSELQ
jgi:WD40 repeat protein